LNSQLYPLTLPYNFNLKYMKHLKLISILCLIIISSQVQASDFVVFINHNGNFVPFSEKADIVNPRSSHSPQSYADYVEALGYSQQELVTPYNNKYCYFIAINPFNGHIAFIMPKNSDKKSYTLGEVNQFLADYEIDAYSFANNLKEGIEHKSIRQSYIENSIGARATENTLVDEKHGFTYLFTNGYLSDYKSNNGLSNDALDLEENFPTIFQAILANAKKSYLDKTSIVQYVNGQSKYFRLIPISYLKQASNFNYALLYCVLYPGMTLDEFNYLVPDATISSCVSNFITMSYNNYIFTFKDKVLIKN